MLRFLLVRIASAIPVLCILSVVTFAIIQAPPGDYADYIRSQLINQGGASYDQAEAQAQAYRVEHGLDKPMVVQYVNWIGGIVTRGDFGYSMYYNKPVADVVAERLPRTLLLALVCHLFASVLGIAEPTVKTHLKRLFEKTGTHRQADLVKLVAGFSNPLLN